MASPTSLLLRLSVAVPVALASIAGVALATSPPPATTSHGTVHGADISWPNCPKGEGIPSRRSPGEPLPTAAAKFVVVGLTNGPGFHPNPCLTSEVNWVNSHDRELGAYALTTLPTRHQLRHYAASGPFNHLTRQGELRNAGYAEATYNVQTMAAIGMVTPMVWVDVEPYPTSPWSSHVATNRDIVVGAIRAYRNSGYRVGIYTYANGWRQVVGAWHLGKYPAWATVGPSGAKAALNLCTRGPSGGVTWLSQWYNTRRDSDLVCPVASGNSSLIFS